MPAETATNGHAKTPVPVSRPAISMFIVDPFDERLGLVTPFVFKRVLEFSKEFAGTDKPARLALSRVVLGDPDVLLIAGVRFDGAVIGHMLGWKETYGADTCLFILQCEVDGPTGDTIARGFELCSEWALARGLKGDVRMATTPDRVRAFERKHGFEVDRVIMKRPVIVPAPSDG